MGLEELSKSPIIIRHHLNLRKEGERNRVNL